MGSVMPTMRPAFSLEFDSDEELEYLTDEGLGNVNDIGGMEGNVVQIGRAHV